MDTSKLSLLFINAHPLAIGILQISLPVLGEGIPQVPSPLVGEGQGEGEYLEDGTTPSLLSWSKQEE